MTKVKCCNNCKACHVGSNQMLCTLKCLPVGCDNLCENYIQKEIMEIIEDGSNSM